MSPPALRNPSLQLPPEWAGGPPPSRYDALVDAVMGMPAGRVLVLGEDGLEILCALIRVGCEQATELLPSERPEPHGADLVAAALPRPWANLGHLLHQGRRALAPEGSIVLQVGGAARDIRAQHAAQLLREAGFDRVHVNLGLNATILVASLAEG